MGGSTRPSRRDPGKRRAGSLCDWRDCLSGSVLSMAVSLSLPCPVRLLAVALAFIALNGGVAGAATVSYVRDTSCIQVICGTSDLLVVDEAGEENNLVVSRPADRVWRVEDSSADLTAGQGCGQESARVVVCDAYVNFVRVHLGAGNDRVLAGPLAVAALLDGGGGADWLTASSTGSSLRGGEGGDNLDGGDGDDTLDGGDGDDTLTGGGGRDTARYDTHPSAVQVDLRKGTAVTVGERDVLSGIEDLYGSPGNDTLTGDDRPNVIDGAAGGDRIRGLGGADRLRGYRGRDDLHGGAGRDVIDGYYTFPDEPSACGSDRDLFVVPYRWGKDEQPNVIPTDCERVALYDEEETGDSSSSARSLGPLVKAVAHPVFSDKAIWIRVACRVRCAGSIRVARWSRGRTVAFGRVRVEAGESRLVRLRRRKGHDLRRGRRIRLNFDLSVAAQTVGGEVEFGSSLGKRRYR